MGVGVAVGTVGVGFGRRVTVGTSVRVGEGMAVAVSVGADVRVGWLVRRARAEGSAVAVGLVTRTVGRPKGAVGNGCIARNSAMANRIKASAPREIRTVLRTSNRVYEARLPGTAFTSNLSEAGLPGCRAGAGLSVFCSWRWLLSCQVTASRLALFPRPQTEDTGDTQSEGDYGEFESAGSSHLPRVQANEVLFLGRCERYGRPCLIR